MNHRQSNPKQWLILNRRVDPEAWSALRRLPGGSGVLLLQQPEARALRRLRNLAAARDLMIFSEAPRIAARVHNVRELRRALLNRTELVLLSPIFETNSHPDWPPLPRMRAAALARLGRRRLLALGGMDAARYARIARLGFIGWAGISAFRT